MSVWANAPEANTPVLRKAARAIADRFRRAATRYHAVARKWQTRPDHLSPFSPTGTLLHDDDRGAATWDLIYDKAFASTTSLTVASSPEISTANRSFSCAKATSSSR